MARDPVEITKSSAINIAKWRLGDQIKSEKDFMRKMMLQSAVQQGGVDQIADTLYDLGIRLSIDRSRPDHAGWLETGAAVEADDS